jgi:hypothetical protein
MLDLILPLPFPQPASFLTDTFQETQAEPIKMLHGTTTLSFVFQGGIVVAVDSRATQGTYIGTSISILWPGGRRSVVPYLLIFLSSQHLIFLSILYTNL